MLSRIRELLETAVERGASDIHLQADTPPMLRLQGELQCFDDVTPLGNEDVLQFIAAISPPRGPDELHAEIVRGLDFAYDVPELTRFRCSAHRHLGAVGIVMRIVPRRVSLPDELGLPHAVQDIARCQRGLTLVTGTSGSGKSTTLASMIQTLNQTVRAKIITIEDPVEFVYEQQEALITQLEVGSDTPSFEQALRQALRQDPDLILIGELRDVETLRMALRAADTGHQVFATLHSGNAAQAVERVIAMFPAAEHRLLLSQLAGSIEAILSQRLVRGKDFSTLRLAYAPITDAGVAALEGLEHLQTLSLHGSAITDAALEQLTQFESLNSLWVQETDVTEEGVNRLAIARPDLTVFHDYGGPSTYGTFEFEQQDMYGIYADGDSPLDMQIR